MAETRVRLPKALSPAEMERIKFETIPWSGEWQTAFGNPERRGVWILWGASGSGKTSFAMQLAKELSKYYKVMYNSLEQGRSLTMQQTMRKHNMTDTRAGRFALISDDIDILERRLASKGAPDVVIIDSVQYTEFADKGGLKRYREFRDKYRNKLFVFVSHAEGRGLNGKIAEKIAYDADIKIYIEGYRAISKGLIFGELDGYYTVWAEGASRYWLNATDTDN